MQSFVRMSTTSGFGLNIIEVENALDVGRHMTITFDERQVPAEIGDL